MSSTENSINICIDAIDRLLIIWKSDLSDKEWGTDWQTLLKLYRSQVCLQLDYGSFYIDQSGGLTSKS